MTAAKRSTAEDFFSAADELPSESVLLSNLFAVSDTVLLHMWFHLRKRGMTVPRNSLTRYTARHLRIRHLVQFIFVGAVYHNALTNCAALLCRACEDFPVCVAVIYLTLRICRDMGAHCAPLRKKKSSAVPLFSQRSHVGNLRQAKK